MKAKIIDGKKIANEIKLEIKLATTKLAKKPGLAVVLVGDDPASHIYVQNKKQACLEAGINSFSYHLETNTSQAALLELIQELNKRKDIDGILVQLPLPNQIDTEKVILSIDPKKDVDGFHPMSQYPSCTPKGIITLLERHNVIIAGKKAVVVGRSNIVGKPLAMMLLDKNATVEICHSKTIDLAKETLSADILIAAVGKAKLIKADMVKEGVVVIDVGTNRIDNKLIGDIDFENVIKKASLISPVPGGVGPMTIASLLQNTLNASLKNLEK